MADELPMEPAHYRVWREAIEKGGYMPRSAEYLDYEGYICALASHPKDRTPEIKTTFNEFWKWYSEERKRVR